jgi:hypothetical protein
VIRKGKQFLPIAIHLCVSIIKSGSLVYILSSAIVFLITPLGQWQSRRKNQIARERIFVRNSYPSLCGWMHRYEVVILYNFTNAHEQHKLPNNLKWTQVIRKGKQFLPIAIHLCVSIIKSGRTLNLLSKFEEKSHNIADPYNFSYFYWHSTLHCKVPQRQLFCKIR